jgi:uncharacterized coiled-coil protein SlyX
MALFNSRKRQDQPTLAPVSEATPAPLPTPAQPEAALVQVAQPAQSSSAPLGAALRLVTAPDTDARTSETAAPASVEAQEARADDLRGLPLGTILFRQGLVEQGALEGALASGMESGERLGEVLIRRELVSEDDIARGLAAQQGLAFLHLEDLTFESDVTALLPTDEARSLGAVAVRLEGDGVLVITPDPSARQRDRLEARLGQRVVEAVVSRGVFDGIVERLESPDQPVLAVAPEFQPVAEVVESTEEPQPQFGELADFAPPADDFTESTDEDETPHPVDEAPKLARHDEEEQMDQAWTETEAVEDGESAPESWSAPTTPQEIWGQTAVEPEPERTVENVEHVEEFRRQDEPEQFEQVEPATEPDTSWTPEPETHAAFDGGSIEDLGAHHDASVGRIDDLLTRIQQGASAYADLRAQINGLSDSLRTTEQTLAEREHRLGELTAAHEGDQRRIDDLVGQLREREEALSGLSGRVEDLTGRLGSAEERLDEREQRLAELDASLAERVRYVEELSAQVERRDDALSAFEQKLNAIAVHFVTDSNA